MTSQESLFSDLRELEKSGNPTDLTTLTGQIPEPGPDRLRLRLGPGGRVG